MRRLVRRVDGLGRRLGVGGVDVGLARGIHHLAGERHLAADVGDRAAHGDGALARRGHLHPARPVQVQLQRAAHGLRRGAGRLQAREIDAQLVARRFPDRDLGGGGDGGAEGEADDEVQQGFVHGEILWF